MRVLGVNHFFEQDLQALRDHAPQHELRVVPYAWIRDLATTVFPARNFSEWASYSEPEFEERERVWDARMAPLLEHLRARFPFDVLILPSDVIFYLRVLVRWCRTHGIPTVVVQKETSITDATMDEHALELRHSLPFISDRMTINSERHKQFWVRAGADADRIAVTGQPRFDAYARGRSADRRPGAPRVLFLSYESDAYIPSSHPLSSWSRLHTQTLEVLAGIARAGAKVRVKPHPQQDRAALQEVRDARALLGDAKESFELLDGGQDTRRLIQEADVVVGFQTTALYEAVLAGTPALFTDWTVPAELESRLLAYEGFGEALRVVASPEALRDHLQARVAAVCRGEPPTALDGDAQQRCEFQLGPLDGGACKRVWGVLGSLSREAPAPAAPSTPRWMFRRRLALSLVRLAFNLGRRKSARLKARRIRLRCEIRLLGDLPLVRELADERA